MSAVASHIPGVFRRGDGRDAQGAALEEFLGRPALRAIISAAPEDGASTRAITVQVVNAAGAPCGGAFAIRVVISTTADGPPAGTQSVTVVSGQTVAVVTAGQVLDLFTAADGSAVFGVQVTGAGTRYVRAVVGGMVDTSEALTWI